MITCYSPRPSKGAYSSFKAPRDLKSSPPSMGCSCCLSDVHKHCQHEVGIAMLTGLTDATSISLSRAASYQHADSVDPGSPHTPIIATTRSTSDVTISTTGGSPSVIRENMTIGESHGIIEHTTDKELFGLMKL